MLNRVLELTLIIQDVVIKCRIFSKKMSFELLMAENLISFFSWCMEKSCLTERECYSPADYHFTCKPQH